MASEKIQSRISQIPDDFGSCAEEYMHQLALDLKQLHPILKHVNYKLIALLLKMTKILIYEKSYVYFEGDMDSPHCYLVLFGNVYLQKKELGVYMKCSIGDFFAEENLL